MLFKFSMQGSVQSNKTRNMESVHLRKQVGKIDDQIQKLLKKKARINSELDRSEGSNHSHDTTEIPNTMQIQTAAIERYMHLKTELQILYNGRASEYDPTAGGYLFPPHGMCQAEIVLKMVDLFHNHVIACEQAMERFEEELEEHPYIPQSPHPMIVLKTTPSLPSASVDIRRDLAAQEARKNIIRKITNTMADKLMAQDGLIFWKTVKPASNEYMKELSEMFTEKSELRQEILVKYGMTLPP